MSTLLRAASCGKLSLALAGGGNAMELTMVATYERVVWASLGRVWENVFDWEHLPWLHRDTFAAIRLRNAGGWGWRADVTMRGAPDGEPPLDIELRAERDAGLYHARTLAGPGAGTDIVTRLTVAAPDRTAVHVEFHVPGIRPEDAGVVGEAFRATYARLWDEDEAMMRRRQAVLDGTLESPARELRVGDRPVRFHPVCPHLGGPLEDVPVEDGCITCPWHGYRFDVLGGQSADGRAFALDCHELGEAPPVVPSEP